ncbi:hypothetical protein [uncultured Pseudoteredinibacter sp.]|uniref:hypothetical protein n=1 Tax=uncultured Pseudoteredinibacter sp. TaxID=1641701 RepID=UPI002627D859|nr:hypothetical protein [uncultured Pseudoteredinibacter sp.]
MFNVKRDVPTPESLKSAGKNYNNPDVLEALNKIFHSKCYICEIKEPTSIAVEHFNADNPNRTDWENLYFACTRCNSNLKGNRYNNLLDPADPETDVFRLVHHRAPSTPNTEITISKATDTPDSKEISETLELINLAFNDASTGNRSVSRSFLRKKVFKVLAKVSREIEKWCDEDTPRHKKKEAEQQIIHFLRVDQEFSAFIRWLILDDLELQPVFGHYIED